MGGIVEFTREHPDLFLDLPPAPITGAQLLEPYNGSFESLVVGFGYASLHLRNESGIELDDQGLASLMGLSLSWAHLRLVPETGDSGE